MLVVAFAVAAVAATVVSVAVNVATGSSSPWLPAVEARPLWWVVGATAAVAGAGLLGWWAQRPTDDTASTTGGTTRAISPESWGDSGTDETPFTEDALLARRFTTDKGIEFALVVGGVRPCDQAASGDGPLVANDVVTELTSRGCTRVVAGVYLEQPGPETTADIPILVSVTIFALANQVAARAVYDYLNGPARWNLTTWCTPSGPGSTPWIPGRDHGYRHQYNRIHHRYVIAAVAHRTDFSKYGGLQPWLTSAAVGAAHASGPQNHLS
ncbi:hypothetical protein GCM10027184_14630 [Saccharothrix stipae]